LQANIQRNNKKKIINDPVYGFITFPSELIYDIIEHPYFQRLRRIKQLGLSHLVYPGANHSRFHHVLGATHLMTLAVQSLKRKGVSISDAEEEAVLAAILLHDIGHGPFSHALEYDIVNSVDHEDISTFFMLEMNRQMNGRLDLAIAIFENKYSEKPFLHQLVSSQLDMDRLDYLNRDSFYTGVTEGQIGAERIIEMLNVYDNNLVIEEKAIYSVEKFLVTRRFMYWQVYLHKTVVAAEQMLIHILRRAKELTRDGYDIFGSPALKYFLVNDVTTDDFKNDPTVLQYFANLDDSDIVSAFKVWQYNDDKILSMLCQRLLRRELFRIEIEQKPFENECVAQECKNIQQQFSLSETEAKYFVYTAKLSNNAYDLHQQNIKMLMKNGKIEDVSIASDNYNVEALSKTVTKYFICYLVEK